MNIQEYFDKMNTVYENLLNFLDDDENNDTIFLIISSTIDQKFRDNKQDITSLLHLIAKVGNKYHKNSIFFSKIEKLLKLFTNEFSNFFSNFELFNIFKKDKRMLLYLIEEKIIIIDEFIAKKITSTKYTLKNYQYYFSPELKPFMNLKWFPKCNDDQSTLREDFEELRKKGENENFICELIRNDSLEEFIVYVNKNNIKLQSNVIPSIFETNNFLSDSKTVTSLIEYSAFFGSIRIFKYLLLNKVDLEPKIWIYAIFGNNAEIIHLLEDCDLECDNDNFTHYLSVSISCHNSSLANYILNNYLQDIDENIPFNVGLKSYNFSFISKEMITENNFCSLCKYDYYQLAYFIMTEQKVDINKII